jgi:uncharacterized protein Yka (UPF0111/DUF47 family)
MTTTVTQPLFVRLHDIDGNTDVIVNVNEISIISLERVSDDNERKATKILFNENSSAECIFVNESPVKIYEMITKSTATTKQK